MEDAGRWGGSGVVASSEVLGRRRIQIGEEGEAQGRRGNGSGASGTKAEAHGAPGGDGSIPPIQ